MQQIFHHKEVHNGLRQNMNVVSKKPVISISFGVFPKGTTADAGE